MTAFTMLLMAVGVLMSSIAGVVCHNGPAALYGSIDWLPHSTLLLSNPEVAFGLGVALVVGGLVCTPRRIH